MFMNNMMNPKGQQGNMSPEDLLNTEGVDTVYSDGSADISLDDGDGNDSEDILDQDLMDEIQNDAEERFYENLVEKFDEETLNQIGKDVIESFEADQQSRSEWEETLETGFSNLGLKPEKITKPFDGACGAFHPLILENAVKFQSKASNELLPAKGPVRMQVLGVS